MAKVQPEDDAKRKVLIRLASEYALRRKIVDKKDLLSAVHEVEKAVVANKYLRTIEIIGILSVGPRSIVLEGNDDVNRIAVKIARKSEQDKVDNSWIENEIAFLQILHGAGFPSIVSSSTSRNEAAYVALSFIDGGNLELTVEGILKSARVTEGNDFISELEKKIEDACRKLVTIINRLMKLIRFIHRQGIFHLDLKPENFIFLRDGSCVLIDLETAASRPAIKEIRTVVRTVGYSHPFLKYSGSEKELAAYDVYSIGAIILSSLKQFESEFGRACNSNYSFSCLQILGELMLDGCPENGLGGKRSGRKKWGEVSLPIKFLDAAKIRSIDDAIEKLDRTAPGRAAVELVPELGIYYRKLINTGSGVSPPFSTRLRTVFDHPVMDRLKKELQLGWGVEVFPGARHSRWEHILGVVGAIGQYLVALSNDREFPLARIILDEEDVETALVAGLLHDVGQTAFGHDFESALPGSFDHETLINDLLRFGVVGSTMTLLETISAAYPKASVERAVGIITRKSGNQGLVTRADVVDPLLRDIVSGPIDADKFDYLPRDAKGCNVPYGRAIDQKRFLLSLCVHVGDAKGFSGMRLAVRQKTIASVEALLLARYQMYRAVYWHHTFRCVQAMFSHAAVETFMSRTAIDIVGDRERFLEMVVLRRIAATAQSLRSLRSDVPVSDVQLELGLSGGHSGETVDEYRYGREKIVEEPALAFVTERASQRISNLLALIASRKLYKRLYEIPLLDVISAEAIASANFPSNFRNVIAEEIEKLLIERISRKIDEIEAESGSAGQSVREGFARSLYRSLNAKEVPLVVVDVPLRGHAKSSGMPMVVDDTARKYRNGRVTASDGDKYFSSIQKLQMNAVMIRVYCSPRVREITRLVLSHDEVKEIVGAVIMKFGKQFSGE